MGRLALSRLWGSPHGELGLAKISVSQFCRQCELLHAKAAPLISSPELTSRSKAWPALSDAKLLIDTIESERLLILLIAQSRGEKAVGALLTLLSATVTLFRNEDALLIELSELPVLVLRVTASPRLHILAVQLIGLLLDLFKRPVYRKRMYQCLVAVIRKSRKYENDVRDQACVSLEYSYASLNKAERRAMISFFLTDPFTRRFRRRQDVQDLVVLHKRSQDMDAMIADFDAAQRGRRSREHHT